MLVHPAQEGFLDRKAGRRTDDAVYTASRTRRNNAFAADPLIYPMIPAQAVRAKDEQAVEAAAEAARLYLFPMIVRGCMGADVAGRVKLIFPPPQRFRFVH